MTASTEESGEPPPEGDQPGPDKKRPSLLVLLARFFGALVVLLIGLLLLIDVYHGPPVAAPFTRVGGATHVETALTASRFWLTSPRTVVTTDAGASEQIMLGAARCAMAYDAPLLFTSQNTARQKLVTANIHDWNRGTAQNPIYPYVIPIQNQIDVRNCLTFGRKADATGLSAFPKTSSLMKLPDVRAQSKLASTVVFAAAWEPGFAPDIAVGMALGAHMATPHHPVSLVVAPRYLEADPGLEATFESQRQLVAGGVVLGQAITVPDDTSALLRQLLTARDEQGILKQADDSLGSVAPFIAALLALFGAAAVAQTGRKVGPELAVLMGKVPTATRASQEFLSLRAGRALNALKRLRALVTKEDPSVPKSNGNQSGDQGSRGPIEWWIFLGRGAKAVVWLRSGIQVEGTIELWHPGNTDQKNGQSRSNAATMLQLKDAELSTGADGRQPMTLVLIPVEDIELMAQRDPDRRIDTNPPTLDKSTQ